MKAFLDTNVCLSAMFSGGLCKELLDLLILERQHEPLVSPVVLNEFERVAHSKFRVPAALIMEAVDFLVDFCVDANEAPSLPTIPDPDDIPIVGAALDARADLFVTGDKVLLALDAVEGLPIRSPRDAFILLRGLPADH